MERAKSTSTSSSSPTPTTTVSWRVLQHSTDQSTISSSAAYHLQYEKKQKNVSRLVATFIAPTSSAASASSSSRPSPPQSTTSAWPAAAMDQVIVHPTITAPPATASSHTRPHPLPPPAPTLATPTATKGPTIFYPTVAPESVVIPIVSSIIGFPILALLVICCLRKRAKLARDRDRRRNYDTQDHNSNMVRFGNRLNGRNSRTLSVCSERSISWAYPSMDLDTVYEERDPEPQRDKY